MSKSAWDNYWASGLQSCFPKESVTDLRLTELWQELIEEADIAPNSNVLELGCGNGFLTSIILQNLSQEGITLNLIDYSNVIVDLSASPHKPAVKLFSDTLIEQTPFADSSIDVIFANFAFEYAQCQPAIAEINRILCPSGVFYLNVHASASQVSNVSLNILRVLDVITEDKALKEAVTDIVSLKLRTDWNNCQATIISLAKQVLQRLKQLDLQFDNAVANSGLVTDLLPLINTTNQNVSTDAITLLWDSYRQYAVRIRHQLSVGYNDEKIESLITAFHAHNIKVSVTPFRIGNEIFSYVIKGQRQTD